MDHLVKMIPSRKRPKRGDVFVIQPKEGIYAFGLVVRIKIPSENLMINGMSLVYVYKFLSLKKEVPKDLMSQDLLFPPQIINNQGWLKGYFQTIGFLDITEFMKRDYGFWDITIKKIVDEEGNPINHKPKYIGDYGVGSYGSISYDVKRALDEFPELLEGIKG
ncbi:immunity 26/phosphotriesterase HocA family protein [Mechercharimyces sp. CAU 1602]|uniref:immunity 26/phosphotriesterase HocA family protein n=1 Tax=Mechercharimyces sp. CAU 1602 TaxID=2973933 RepID=UPI0021612997|nr:immunity 26/phosphotriesterase HocA family protein [Mechercharimyces sp. CAU 1602]MCS1350870.1 immunity 26/phosphotriesterase HocA family protein [Mechercharimyces sp. CAU 1602]